MSQKETTDSSGHLEVIDSPEGNLSKLAELARRAYEQKRKKECLDLTRTMLLIDPNHADALWMRSSIQAEMQLDLENARAFFRQAHSKEKAETQSQPGHAAVAAGLPSNTDDRDIEAPVPLVDSKRTPGTRWLMRASVLVALGLVVVVLPRFRGSSNPVDAALLTLNASDRSRQIADVKATQPDPSLLSRPADVALASTPAPISPATEQPKPAQQALFADPSKAAVPPAPRPAAKLPDQQVIAAAGGTLAVSSPTPVDIYKDDAYIGSAPVSLALPEGAQTLEYRHGNLRKNVTHVIRSNETTRAMITFDVSVQINSKPWAEVFVDGVERKALGQTPLSGVRVPIGSVLIFENPQFQTKKYRVTGNETGIQIVFP